MKSPFNKIKTVIESHQKQLANLGTRHLAIFGSAARGEARKSSDIDILADIDPIFIHIKCDRYLFYCLNKRGW